MAVELYKTVESLFVLAGYENGGTVLWEINNGKSRLIWERQEHKEPGKRKMQLANKMLKITQFSIYLWTQQDLILSLHLQITKYVNRV